MKNLIFFISIIVLVISELGLAQGLFHAEKNSEFQTRLKYLMRSEVSESWQVPTIAIFPTLLKSDDRIMTIKTHPELYSFIESRIVQPLCLSKTGRFICQDFFARENGYHGSSIDLTSAIMKKLIFIESTNLLLSIDSFAYFGEAWIFIHADEVTEEHLLRMISHELFQLVDIKNLIHIDPRIRQLFLTDETDCKALSVLRNEDIRLSASAIRSFIVEDRIVGEVLGRQTGYGLEKLSCVERIKKVLKQVQSIPEELGAFGMNIERRIMRKPENKCLTLTQDFPFEEALRFSKSMSVLDSEKSVRLSVCDFLVTPSFIGNWSTPLAPKSFMQGPRPRIGDP